MNVQTKIENSVPIEEGAKVLAYTSCHLVYDPDSSFLTGTQAVALNSLTTYSSLLAPACQLRPKRPLRAVQIHLSGVHAVNMPLIPAIRGAPAKRPSALQQLRLLISFRLPPQLYVLFRVKYTVLT